MQHSATLPGNGVHRQRATAGTQRTEPATSRTPWRPGESVYSPSAHEPAEMREHLKSDLGLVHQIAAERDAGLGSYQIEKTIRMLERRGYNKDQIKAWSRMDHGTIGLRKIALEMQCHLDNIS